MGMLRVSMGGRNKKKAGSELRGRFFKETPMGKAA
jgi:protein gp37